MDRRLRVLHLFTDAFVLPWSADAADPVSALTWPATSFARYGNHDRFEVTIGSLTPPALSTDGIGAVQVQVFPWNRRAVDPMSVGRLVRWLREKRIDIVHTHLFHATLLGLAAAKVAGVSVAVTTAHHSHELPISGRRPVYWADAFALKKLAHHVIAPCRVMRDILVYGYGLEPERVPVIQHGVDAGRFTSSPGGRERVRMELGVQNRVVLGALGRLNWIKQYSTLIESFAELSARFPETTLVIAGFGNDRDSLLALARRLGVADRVLLVGGRADVPDFMAAADLFVHPSRSESFGLVLIEAMAAGKPVLSTDVGIAPDILADEQAGMIVPVGDPAALTRGLGRLLEMRDRWEEMGREAQRRARTFTAQRMVREYENHHLDWFWRKGGDLRERQDG